jgi:hypothetical protein
MRAPLALLLVALIACLACSDSNDRGPTAPEVLSALTLTVSASTAPADGFTRVELIARIDPNADANKRTILFSSTAGTLVGANGGTLQVTADQNGQAQAFLQAPNTPQAVFVDASVVNASSVLRRVEIQFVTVDPNSQIKIGTSSSSLPADGATTIQVFADLAAGLPSGQRTVIFTASGGMLVQTSATADGSNRATVDLRAPGALGDIRVTATAAGITAQTTVAVFRALPDTVLVSTGKIQLQASLADSTTISANLVRNLGTATANTIVTYSLIDPTTGAPINAFISNVTPSNASGTSTATLSVGSTTFRGTARVVARVEGGRSGQANIEIVDP